MIVLLICNTVNFRSVRKVYNSISVSTIIIIYKIVRKYYYKQKNVILDFKQLRFEINISFQLFCLIFRSAQTNQPKGYLKIKEDY